MDALNPIEGSAKVGLCAWETGEGLLVAVLAMPSSGIVFWGGAGLLVAHDPIGDPLAHHPVPPATGPLRG